MPLWLNCPLPAYNYLIPPAPPAERTVVKDTPGKPTPVTGATLEERIA